MMSEAIFVLLGSLIGYSASIIKDIINNKYGLQKERIKLHDKEKIDAYKQLFVLIRKLSNSCYPLADNKHSAFLAIMKNYYKNKVELMYPYYSSDIMSKLDTLDSNYTCLTEPDLIPETQDEVNDFINNELFGFTKKIEDQLKKDVKRIAG